MQDLLSASIYSSVFPRIYVFCNCLLTDYRSIKMLDAVNVSERFERHLLKSCRRDEELKEVEEVNFIICGACYIYGFIQLTNSFVPEVWDFPTESLGRQGLHGGKPSNFPRFVQCEAFALHR
jgi:hypothetical protein